MPKKASNNPKPNPPNDQAPSFTKLCSKFNSPKSSNSSRPASPNSSNQTSKSQKLKQPSIQKKNTSKSPSPKKDKMPQKQTSKLTEENLRQYESFSLRDDYVFVQAIIQYHKEKPPRQRILESLSQKLERTVCSIRRRWERLSQFTIEQQNFVCQYFEKYPTIAQNRKISFKTDYWSIVQSLGRGEEDFTPEELTYIKELKIECLALVEPRIETSVELSDEELEEESDKSVQIDQIMDQQLSEVSSSEKDDNIKEKEYLDFRIEEMSPDNDDDTSPKLESHKTPEVTKEKREQINRKNSEKPEENLVTLEVINETPKVERKSDEVSKQGICSQKELSDNNEEKDASVKSGGINEDHLGKIISAPDFFVEESLRKYKFKKIKCDFLSEVTFEDLDFKVSHLKNCVFDDEQNLEEKSELLVDLMSYFSDKFKCSFEELKDVFGGKEAMSMDEMKVRLCYYDIEKRGH